MKKILLLFIISFFFKTSFAQLKTIPGTKPFVLGIVDELQSEILAEKRILNIYLPEGYDPADTISYPVFYLLDGSADEDFIHTVGIVQFNNFSWINRVPKSIVVGIANTDRGKNFTFPTAIDEHKKLVPGGGHSAAFISFIEKELQPFIVKKYKANGFSTIIGQSLGGLLATEILLTRPGLFNQYIIISPSIWWDNGSLLRMESEIFEESFISPLRIYIGVGKEGATPGTNPGIMEVDANLLSHKISVSKSKTVKVFFDYLKEENHATISHLAIFNAMRFLYPPDVSKEDAHK